jgi:hypothetical protein
MFVTLLTATLAIAVTVPVLERLPPAGAARENRNG